MLILSKLASGKNPREDEVRIRTAAMQRKPAKFSAGLAGVACIAEAV